MLLLVIILSVIIVFVRELIVEESGKKLNYWMYIFVESVVEL